MPVLWTLQMSTRKKFAVSFVFGLGTFSNGSVVFSTAWRTYNVIEFSEPAAQMNFTIAVIDDALWSGLEITLSIINACLPVLQPSAQRILNASYTQLLTFSSTRRSSTKNSKASGGYSTTSSDRSQLRTWGRLGSSKGELKTGIEREVEYSVDVESHSENGVPMENVGSFTKLTTQNPVSA
ncbi:hypothetical protein GGR55DRAFT_673004 [Xylaria sp. FL0064]|nr:hypothetical protein GGR55DRAFT_673004 [Xylaria sp. FL0064]